MARQGGPIYNPYMKPDYLKLAGLFIFGGYIVRAALNPAAWHLIDGVDLIFHEAGHALSMAFPYWLQIAGGSIFQVLLPLIVAAVSFIKRQYYTGSMVLLWAGQSLINVSVYAGDALRMQLPLISDGAEHDWNYLLWYFGALRHTAAIARTIEISGILTIFAGAALSLWFSFKKERSDFEELRAV